MKKKVCWIVSDVDKSYSFEWQLIRLKNYYSVFVILLKKESSPFEDFLNTNNISFIRLNSNQNHLFLLIRIIIVLIKKRPNIVHTHLIRAQILGLFASWLLRINKRIYTRHNSTFHHRFYPRKKWLDLLSNFFSIHVVSVSKSTDYVLMSLEKCSDKKIRKIYHGFDFAEMQKKSMNYDTLKQKYKIKQDTFVIGIISRAIQWKGIQYIIPALKKFITEYPDTSVIIANFSGPYKNEILNMIEPSYYKYFTFIEFEPDIFSLYKIMDVFIHTPINSDIEAFGQVYIESMFFGIPLIATPSGIGAEILKDNENSLIVPFENSVEIYNKLKLLKNNPRLRQHLSENAKNTVQIFDIDTMIQKLIKLYNE